MPTVRELIKHLEESHQKNDFIAYTLWTTGDIQSRARDLGKQITRAQAADILEEMHHRQDAGIGINWDVVDTYLP